jgi:catechol 2,3-dioxygenase-like lactoylglutathione lyase family enzyme
MQVQFVTSVAPIVRDVEVSRSFYADALGLGFEGQEGDYVFTHELEGTKHFGLWPLSEAANACFGTTEWPTEIPAPQASIEFEVADVRAAAAELTAKGYRLIHDAHTAVGSDHRSTIEPRRSARGCLLHPGVSGPVGDRRYPRTPALGLVVRSHEPGDTVRPMCRYSPPITTVHCRMTQFLTRPSRT